MMTTQTIIGMFETSEDAGNARQALLANGFEDRFIKLDNHVDTEEDLVTDGQMTDTTEKSTAGFPFGLANPSKEGSVLTVQISSPEQMNIASEILKDHGAVDVNEFSESNPE